MADEKIMIQVEAELDKALQNFKKLEQQIKSTQKTVNNQLNPSVNNTSTRLTGLGNRISGFGSKIKGAIGTETALAFGAAGTAALGFTKQCVDSAIKSESEWARFGSLARSSTTGWSADSMSEMKTWAKTFSNNIGYAVSDTRNAMSALMQYGMSANEAQNAMKGVAGVAARTGQTEEEASQMIISALNGRGMALAKQTGLRIEDYKNADGQIDRERLLNDLYNQNKDAIEAHSNTTEAQIQRMNNAWNSFKTSIGQALAPVVKILADFVTWVATGFSKMDGPVKTIVATLLALGAVIGVVVGALGLLAPVIINVGKMISALGKLKGMLNLGSLGSWETLRSKVSSATSAISNFGIKAKLTNAGSKISGAISSSWSALTGKIRSATSAISSYGIQSKIASAGSAIKGAAMSAWSTITSAINRAKVAITSFSIRQAVSSAAMKAHAAATAIWNGATKAAAVAQGILNAVMAMNPIYLVVAAVVALIAVLGYLYFNNEQVRNTINALGDYLRGIFIPIWNALVGTLTNVWNWFMQIWNGSKSLGEAFGDIGALIGSVFGGLASWIGGALSGIGGAANDALQGLWDAFRAQLGGLGEWIGQTLSKLPEIITNALSNLGNTVIPGGGLVAGIMAIFAPLPMMILGIFNRLFPSVLPALMGFVNGVVQWFSTIGSRIAQTIMALPMILSMHFMMFIQQLQMRLTQARAIAGMLVSMLRQAIISRLTGIVTRARMVFMLVVQAIRTRLNQARAIAGNLAGMIRQAIVNRLNALVGRVRALFARVVSTVRSRLSNAVSAAREKAMEIVNNVIQYISSLPDKVAAEFNKIPDKVRSALANAAAAAAAGAKDIASRFLAGLGVASPGIAQRTTEWEFGSIPGIITDKGILAAKATEKMAKGISNTWTQNKPDLSLNSALQMSYEDYNKIPQIPLQQRLNTDLLSINLNRQLPNNNPYASGYTNTNTTNHNVTKDDHTINYHIDKITLECADLTQEQSRRVLYNALDGLYTRGT